MFFLAFVCYVLFTLFEARLALWLVVTRYAGLFRCHLTALGQTRARSSSRVIWSLVRLFCVAFFACAVSAPCFACASRVPVLHPLPRIAVNCRLCSSGARRGVCASALMRVLCTVLKFGCCTRVSYTALCAFPLCVSEACASVRKVCGVGLVAYRLLFLFCDFARGDFRSSAARCISRRSLSRVRKTRRFLCPFRL